MGCRVGVILLAASILLSSRIALGQSNPSCQTARDSLSTGHLESARAQFEACISAGLPSLQDLIDLGDIYSQLGNYAGASHVFQRAVALNPQSPEVHMKLGWALVQNFHYPEAAREFGKTLVLQPDNHRAEDLLAMSLFQLKQYELAALAARHVHEVKPEEASATFILGSCYLRLHLYQQALPLLQLAAAKTGSAEVRAILGEAYIGLHAYRQALNEFLQAEKVNSRIQGLHSEIGAAYAALGQTDAALAEYGRALEQDPQDFAASYFMGRISRLRGDYKKAEEFLAKANHANPEDPSVLFEYSVLAVQDKDYAKAANLLKQVLNQLPDYVDAHVMLAQVYFHLHQVEEGKREKAVADALQKAQQERQAALRVGAAYGGSSSPDQAPRR